MPRTTPPVPDDARTRLLRAQAQFDAAEVKAMRLREAAMHARAKAVADEAEKGLSLRQIGSVLGLSHSRIQQLVDYARQK